MQKLRLCISVLVFFLSSTLNAQEIEVAKQTLENYLLESTQLRQQLHPIISKYGFESPQMDSLNRLMQLSDSTNMARIRPFIETYGWLGQSEIGWEANNALFLIVQHSSDEDRLKYFPLLKASAEAGESDLASMALMEDRILVYKEGRQKYGTQSHMVNGELELYPIKDLKRVNKLRRSVGLPRLPRNK